MVKVRLTAIHAALKITARPQGVRLFMAISQISGGLRSGRIKDSPALIATIRMLCTKLGVSTQFHASAGGLQALSQASRTMTDAQEKVALAALDGWLTDKSVLSASLEELYAKYSGAN